MHASKAGAPRPGRPRGESLRPGLKARGPLGTPDSSTARPTAETRTPWHAQLEFCGSTRWVGVLADNHVYRMTKSGDTWVPMARHRPLPHFHRLCLGQTRRGPRPPPWKPRSAKPPTAVALGSPWNTAAPLLAGKLPTGAGPKPLVVGASGLRHWADPGGALVPCVRRTRQSCPRRGQNCARGFVKEGIAHRRTVGRHDSAAGSGRQGAGMGGGLGALSGIAGARHRMQAFVILGMMGR